MKKLLSLFVLLWSLMASQAFAMVGVDVSDLWISTTGLTTPTNSVATIRGTRFHSTVPGYIIAVRYYRVTGDTEPKLWTIRSAVSGSLGAYGQFASNGSGGTWSLFYANYSTFKPLFISAGEVVIFSVRHTTTTMPYPLKANAFSSGPITSGQLVAEKGVWIADPTNQGPLPTTETNDAYIMDVVFVPAFYGLYQ